MQVLHHLLSAALWLAVVLLLFLQQVTHIFFLLQQVVLWISGADLLIRTQQKKEKFGTFVSAITPALFAALLWKKVTVQGATCSIVSGTVITLANEFSHQPLGLPSAIMAIPVSVLLLYFVSKATYKGPTEKDKAFFAAQGEEV